MKKILFSTVALLIALLATSCSNDDIATEIGGQRYDLTYNINTSTMYETFELISDIRDNYLRDQSMCVGVTSFLYDESGNLVDKAFTSQFTFNPVTQNFENLLDGNYTIVTVETLVDPEDGYKAEDWEFAGEEKLTTLRVKQMSHYAYRTSVLGTCSVSVTISSANASVNGVPQAIGSLVEIHFDNFEKSTHAYVGFATDDAIEAYKLDPRISRNERFVEDQTAKGFVNVRGFLSAADSENHYITLYLLESSIDYSFRFVKAENVEKGIWTSYNANTGTVSLSDGVRYYGGFWYKDASSIPESYFGNANGYIAWRQALIDGASKTIAITLPYMSWGASVSNVSMAMNSYTQTTGTSSKGELQGDGSYLIEYKGKNTENKIAYFFKTETSGLFESDLFFDKNKVGEDELLKYANDNYTFLAQSGTSYMFSTKDNKTYVMVMENGDYWLLGFVDVDYLSSSKANAIFNVNNICKAPTNLTKPFIESNSDIYFRTEVEKVQLMIQSKK